ncbi:hypothetical protein BaRGS_00022377 [Batillaria attramentaria]|uniref:Uncharacterized protein n=1 Tax=Batillaria attramentaria TaxID=370345 RepID=A0ABD0KGV7_9CAEN
MSQPAPRKALLDNETSAASVAEVMRSEAVSGLGPEPGVVFQFIKLMLGLHTMLMSHEAGEDIPILPSGGSL